MLQRALENLNITGLNPMQQAALEAAAQRDVVLLAPTGSGKTLGFLSPLLARPPATRNAGHTGPGAGTRAGVGLADRAGIPANEYWFWH
jgi:superfamily II DNA/RNA helicase